MKRNIYGTETQPINDIQDIFKEILDKDWNVNVMYVKGHDVPRDNWKMPFPEPIYCKTLTTRCHAIVIEYYFFPSRHAPESGKEMNEEKLRNVCKSQNYETKVAKTWPFHCHSYSLISHYKFFWRTDENYFFPFVNYRILASQFWGGVLLHSLRAKLDSNTRREDDGIEEKRKTGIKRWKNCEWEWKEKPFGGRPHSRWLVSAPPNGIMTSQT